MSVSSLGAAVAQRSHTLSPPSPIVCGSAHSTPTLGANSRIVQSTSMQFGEDSEQMRLLFVVNNGVLPIDRLPLPVPMLFCCFEGAQRSPKPSRLVHAIPHKWARPNKFRLSNTDSGELN